MFDIKQSLVNGAFKKMLLLVLITLTVITMRGFHYTTTFVDTG